MSPKHKSAKADEYISIRVSAELKREVERIASEKRWTVSLTSRVLLESALRNALKEK
jgi:predicted transcriptional regulator